jgi:hypothetical protein
MKASLQHRQGLFTNSKNGRVSDKLLTTIIWFDCSQEIEAIRLEVFQGRTDYYCAITVKIELSDVYLQSNARGGNTASASVGEAVRAAFANMGISWEYQKGESIKHPLASTDIENILEAIGNEIGVKRPRLIQAGAHPIYRI